MSVYLGCDIGTVSLKGAAVVADPDLAGRVRQQRLLVEIDPATHLDGPLKGCHLFLSPYRRINGNPVAAARHLIDELASFFPAGSITNIALTGSGGKRPAELLGLTHYSDFRSIATGVGLLYPDVVQVLEMGGENSKFLCLHKGGEQGRIGIVDYDSNGDCAAGTGSFLDQQSSRLRYRVEEIGEVVATADRSAKIAGRCSVFAKSDMIHAQQKGETPPQILKGLCDAVARNFKGNIAKGRELNGRTAFVGGVANNSGVFDAVRQVFGVTNGKLFVPPSPAFYGAIGAALLKAASGNGEARLGLPNWSAAEVVTDFPAWPRLTTEQVRFLADEIAADNGGSSSLAGDKPFDAFLGIDIGSVSTNLVLLDAAGEVIHEIYLRTQGRPVEVVSRGLQEIERLYGSRAKILGVGTTGSGRELIGELVGADAVKDEITAHKTGASRVARRCLDRPVDSIFEIGGQDSKFISLSDGVVVDFTMNEACAAGTGSFLEEQAEKLNVNIIDEFAEKALRAPAPIRLGERCTVYMEMDITAFLRNGARQENIIAGLAYSVVQNYLNRVVRSRPIGDVIFFQGGTAYNRAVAAAFSTVTGKTIIVPPHNGVMGAYGAALLAQEQMVACGEPSKFRGFDIDSVQYRVREFTCNACTNACDIKEFEVEGEKTYWGDKCSDRFRKQAKVDREPVIEDLFAIREELLEKDWLKVFAANNNGDELRRLAERVRLAGLLNNTRRYRVGMPRAMYYYQRHPFWKTYFEALGCELMVSGPTTKAVTHAGIEGTVAEPCFPIQVAHGHLRELTAAELDFIVVPAHINDATSTPEVQSHLCPFGQTLPFLLKHSPVLNRLNSSYLTPLIHFRQGPDFVEKELWKQIGVHFGSRRHHRLAVTLAFAAQGAFGKAIQAAGNLALKQVESAGENAIVLVGRPYNLYDPGLNLNLAAKLRQQYGANVIPLDYIDSDGEDLQELNSNMFWNYGRKILQTTLWSRRHPKFHLIYLTNFMCGPDSFIKTFAAQGAGQPFLTLQFDGHGNDAGMMTRCEAYLDSKGLLR